MSQLLNVKISFFVAVIFLFAACSRNKSVDQTSQFGIFKVKDDGLCIVMNGEIGRRSLKNFDRLNKAFPEVKQINIMECGGSMDDETNLKLSQKVYENKMAIHLLDNGMIASGGVDFFLSGRKRTKGKNTKIGVHSWAGEDDKGKTISAIDFPEGHEFHQPYIQYYQSVGFNSEEAKAFYFFTINAAAANNIHWMTDAEILKYKMLKE